MFKSPILQKHREAQDLDRRIKLQYGEDLPSGLIRAQIEDLRKQLDPTVYRVRTNKSGKK